MYDGIHYDPLAVHSPNDPSKPLQTVFPVVDDTRLAEALEIAAAAKKVSLKWSGIVENSTCTRKKFCTLLNQTLILNCIHKEFKRTKLSE